MVNAPLTLVTGSMKSSREPDQTRAGPKRTKPVRPRFRTHPSRSNAVPTPNSLDSERTQAELELERTRPRRNPNEPKPVESCPNSGLDAERTRASRRRPTQLRSTRSNPSRRKLPKPRSPSNPNEPQAELEFERTQLRRNPNEPKLARDQVLGQGRKDLRGAIETQRRPPMPQAARIKVDRWRLGCRRQALGSRCQPQASPPSSPPAVTSDRPLLPPGGL